MQIGAQTTLNGNGTKTELNGWQDNSCLNQVKQMRICAQTTLNGWPANSYANQVEHMRIGAQTKLNGGESRCKPIYTDDIQIGV